MWRRLSGSRATVFGLSTISASHEKLSLLLWVCLSLAKEEEKRGPLYESDNFSYQLLESLCQIIVNLENTARWSHIKGPLLPLFKTDYNTSQISLFIFKRILAQFLWFLWCDLFSVVVVKSVATLKTSNSGFLRHMRFSNL